MLQFRQKESDMEKFDHYILGETDEEITLKTSDQSRIMTIQMINNCRRYLNIISRDLDPCIYDNKEMLDAIKKLVLRSRLSQVRIIILQPDTLYSHGHRLLNLSERLSSFIQIRIPKKEDRSFNQAFFIADNSGYLRRPYSDRFEGQGNYNDRKAVSNLLNEFELLWENAKPDPNFRRLSL